jgi:hypothetical protein
VGVDEVAQVVDFVVDDCPEVFFGVVLVVVGVMLVDVASVFGVVLLLLLK